MGLLRHFVRDDRGHVAVIGALALPILIGGIAFGTEAGDWLVEKTKLSFVADATVLSAGQLYNRGKTEAQIATILRAKLVADGYPDASLALNLTYPDAASDQITAEISYSPDKYFAQAIWDGAVVIRARTVAVMEGDEACVLALNPTASGAVTVGGSATMSLTGCVVASNSSSTSSVYMGGSSTLTTECIISSGGINGEAHATTQCQKNRTYRRPTPDPFADLTQPATPGHCHNPPNFNPTGTYSVSAGCYDHDFDVKGTVTFGSGVYILDGADLKINSSAIVTGTDVTFVLKNGAELNFNGGATINLTAPEAGSAEPYPGILFWGSDTNNASHKINGDASSVFAGAIYMPDDAVEFTGSSGMDSACTRVVADTITLSGNTGFETDCSDELGAYDLSTAQTVIIVE
ncbi:hypothetical protein [Oricola sp.]|uniref:TadE/TadG family type IV pilus assembly protein n=1 Tax=Oricola sp. TaxID=1979950 RepID=UPI0025E0D7A6|nr:hypothetical protein [Oricola sp.]MCI5078516.1 hypothetical protein [Oricola sp.]